MISPAEKELVFAEELELIFDESIREFTRLCLISAPDYFFQDCPASTTGKYHPLDELGHDGTLIHTKKVVTVAYELCRALECENKRDEIMSACIIHDLRKRGLEKGPHTLRNHPDLAAQLVDQVQLETRILTDESYQIIRNAIGYHYGPWSSNNWKKPIMEFTKEELCVYIADYVSSKRCVSVNYRRKKDGR